MKIIVTDDAPVQDVKLALAKEYHDRQQVMRELIAYRRVHVVEDNDASTIRVRVGDQVFACPRETFPTTILIANVQLALYAGVGNDPDGPAGLVLSSYLEGYQEEYSSFARKAIDRITAMKLFPPTFTKAFKKKGLRP